MTSEQLTIREAALFAYRNHYVALSKHLDLSDKEMSRIFREAELQAGRDVNSEPAIKVRVRLRRTSRE